jgi:hypothetical protein
MRLGLLLSLLLVASLAPAHARGAETVDRVIYLFEAPETGGASTPRQIFERELALEARIEALAAGEPLLNARGQYAARHIRAALDRHIATDLLAHLPVDTAGRGDKKLPVHPCEAPFRAQDGDDLENRMQLARAVLTLRIRGPNNRDNSLRGAVDAEGLNDFEFRRILRREALAARYLDMMVAPMLEPSDSELRELLRAAGNPFRGKEFDKVRCELRRWVLNQRLSAALSAFLQSSRSRVRLRRIR